MLTVGEILNRRYKLLRRVGSGGTATVFLARDLILDREVAVKVLHSTLYQDEKMLKRFQREAKAISELDDENIVSLYDVDEEGQVHYLVMEYVDGTDLKNYIRQNYPLSTREVIDIMKQVVRAVSVAHQKGIIHRDLKTQNVLIRKDGVIKITDFGIATNFSETAVTQTNTMIGSIHYLSPEQARGQKASMKSDIYAMGIMMYELLVGTVPFNGDSAVSIAMKHFQTPLPNIRENAVQDIPQGLENVILKATAKRAENRYADCFEMLSDLNMALDPSRRNVPKFVEPPVVYEKKTQAKDIKKTVVTKKESTKKLVASANIKQSKKRTLRTVLAVLAVVVFGLVVWLIQWNSGQNITVPDVSGKTQVEAVQILTDSGLIVGDIEMQASDTVESGLIIRTNPTSNATVKRNSRVNFVISSGAITENVRNYLGRSYEEVYTELTRKGYTVKRSEESSQTVAAGNIISQNINAGTQVIPKETTITFVVSSGIADVGSDAYVGVNAQTATSQLQQNGYTVETREEASSQRIGTVIRHSQNNKTVTLVVSQGQEMPNFNRVTQSSAVTKLRELGLTPIIQEEYSSTVARGSIIRQTPAVGTAVDVSTSIQLVVSLGAQIQEQTTTTTNIQ